ncbi:MAG TPA: rhomboid family intramembrane serine protease [Dehalococcoidia bacterium]|nr:rhomboid family intramembrane serine protease [Dehalococcoidia bacterium]
MRSYNRFNLNAIWFLIIVNVLIFIVTLVRPDVITFLGLTPAYFRHQPWTIITNLFVHAGWWHIIFNMICLYSLGSFLTRLIGEKNFLKVYFAGGVLGNIFFLAYNPYPDIPGIGASGAISAIIGVLVIMAPKLPVIIFPIPVTIPLWVAIIIFLLISFLPGIAWQAHLGGLALGLIAGYFFKKKRRTYYF